MQHHSCSDVPERVPALTVMQLLPLDRRVNNCTAATFRNSLVKRLEHKLVEVASPPDKQINTNLLANKNEQMSIFVSVFTQFFEKVSDDL